MRIKERKQIRNALVTIIKVYIFSIKLDLWKYKLDNCQIWIYDTLSSVCKIYFIIHLDLCQVEVYYSPFLIWVHYFQKLKSPWFVAITYKLKKFYYQGLMHFTSKLFESQIIALQLVLQPKLILYIHSSLFSSYFFCITTIESELWDHQKM